MIKLKKMRGSFLTLALLTGLSIIIQAHVNTYAANTIGSNYEVITVKGTDGQPVDTIASFADGGNLLTFESNAVNLPNSNGLKGLYVYDIKNQLATRVDVSTTGVVADGSVVTSSYRISANGRYVTFMSFASNLIDGTTSMPRGIYKRDLQAGITTSISSDFSTGAGSNIDRNLSISDDGRFILLASRYINNTYPYSYGLVYGDSDATGYGWTVLGRGTENEGSWSSTSTLGNLSCDGSFAVFTNNYGISLADLRKGVKITSLTSGSNSSSPLISCNGRYILYATENRTDISPTPSGMDTKQHLVRYDRLTGKRMYVDSNSLGTFGVGVSYNTLIEPQSNVFGASISDTGDVVFRYNGYAYLKHLSDGSGTLEAIAKDVNGGVVNISGATLSSDGRYVLFNEDPYNLGLANSLSTKKPIRIKTGL